MTGANTGNLKLKKKIEENIEIKETITDNRIELEIKINVEKIEEIEEIEIEEIKEVKSYERNTNYSYVLPNLPIKLKKGLEHFVLRLHPPEGVEIKDDKIVLKLKVKVKLTNNKQEIIDDLITGVEIRNVSFKPIVQPYRPITITAKVDKEGKIITENKIIMKIKNISKIHDVRIGKSDIIVKCFEDQHHQRPLDVDIKVDVIKKLTEKGETEENKLEPEETGEFEIKLKMDGLPPRLRENRNTEIYLIAYTIAMREQDMARIIDQAQQYTLIINNIAEEYLLSFGPNYLGNVFLPLEHWLRRPEIREMMKKFPKFIERREKEKIKKLILQDNYEGIIIAGDGGTGKTRLAIEVAKEFQKLDNWKVYYLAANPKERFNEDTLDLERSYRYLFVIDEASKYSPIDNILNAIHNFNIQERPKVVIIVVDRIVVLQDHKKAFDRSNIIYPTTPIKLQAESEEQESVLREFIDQYYPSMRNLSEENFKKLHGNFFICSFYGEYLKTAQDKETIPEFRWLFNQLISRYINDLVNASRINESERGSFYQFVVDFLIVLSFIHPIIFPDDENKFIQTLNNLTNRFYFYNWENYFNNYLKSIFSRSRDLCSYSEEEPSTSTSTPKDQLSYTFKPFADYILDNFINEIGNGNIRNNDIIKTLLRQLLLFFPSNTLRNLFNATSLADRTNTTVIEVLKFYIEEFLNNKKYLNDLTSQDISTIIDFFRAIFRLTEPSFVNIFPPSEWDIEYYHEVFAKSISISSYSDSTISIVKGDIVTTPSLSEESITELALIYSGILFNFSYWFSLHNLIDKLDVVLAYNTDLHNNFSNNLDVVHNYAKALNNAVTVYGQAQKWGKLTAKLNELQKLIGQHPKDQKVRESYAKALFNAAVSYIFSGYHDPAEKILDSIKELYSQDPHSAIIRHCYVRVLHAFIKSYDKLDLFDKANEKLGLLESLYKNHRDDEFIEELYFSALSSSI